MSRIAGTSAELEQLQRRIERWRMSRVSQGRMPEPLWAAAAEMAAHHGVSRVASALGLGYAGLKQRVEAAVPRGSVPEAEEVKSVDGRQKARESGHLLGSAPTSCGAQRQTPHGLGGVTHHGHAREGPAGHGSPLLGSAERVKGGDSRLASRATP